MAKKPGQNKKKRQPALSQLPSSSAKKKLINAVNSKAGLENRVTKKTSRKVTKNSASATKKSVSESTVKSSANSRIKKSTRPKVEKNDLMTAKSPAIAKQKVKRKKATTQTARVRKSPKTKKISLYVPFARQKIQITFRVSDAKSKAKSKKKSRATTKKSKLSRTGHHKFRWTMSDGFRYNLALFLVMAGLFGTVYFSLQVIASAAPAPINDLSSINSTVQLEPGQSEPKTLPASMAKRLQIPEIGIDAEVMSVGKNPDNTIEVPSDYHVAGQYEFAPTPGELGPAIIVGHVDNYKGPGVFWRLREAQPGQIIKISRQDGSVAEFRVDAIVKVSQNDFPTEKIYGNINHAGLRLITCGGTFNVLTQRYSDNTVVFASLIEDSIPDKKTSVQDIKLPNNSLTEYLQDEQK